MLIAQEDLSRVSARGQSAAAVRPTQEDRDHGLSVGIEHGGVEDALVTLGWASSKSSIYRDVQEADEAVQRIRQARGCGRHQYLLVWD